MHSLIFTMRALNWLEFQSLEQDSAQVSSVDLNLLVCSTLSCGPIRHAGGQRLGLNQPAMSHA